MFSSVKISLTRCPGYLPSWISLMHPSIPFTWSDKQKNGCLTLPTLHDSREEPSRIYINRVRYAAVYWVRDRDYPEIRILEDLKIFVREGWKVQAHVWNQDEIVLIQTKIASGSRHAGSSLRTMMFGTTDRPLSTCTVITFFLIRGLKARILVTSFTTTYPTSPGWGQYCRPLRNSSSQNRNSPRKSFLRWIPNS